MVRIKPTSKKSVKDFNDQTWHAVDIEHYGKRVEWKEKVFRFKALDRDRVVGTISGRLGGGVLYIEALIVDEKERNKGIGKALMLKSEKLGIKYGAHKITLNTGKDWTSRKFYESIGFNKEGNLPNHYFKHDFVSYTKFLP